MHFPRSLAGIIDGSGKRAVASCLASCCSTTYDHLRPPRPTSDSSSAYLASTLLSFPSKRPLRQGFRLRTACPPMRFHCMCLHVGQQPDENGSSQSKEQGHHLPHNRASGQVPGHATVKNTVTVLCSLADSINCRLHTSMRTAL